MEFGISFLVAFFFVTFALLAAYRVRHADEPFIDWIKSWFK